MFADCHTLIKSGEVSGPADYLPRGVVFCLVAYVVSIAVHLSVARPKVAPGQPVVNTSGQEPPDLATLARAVQYVPSRGLSWAR